MFVCVFLFVCLFEFSLFRSFFVDKGKRVDLYASLNLNENKGRERQQEEGREEGGKKGRKINDFDTMRRWIHGSSIA